MIVNIIGPPAAGKSYFCSRYVAEHPAWRYNSIDSCRLDANDEDEAWKSFEYFMNINNGWSAPVPGVLVESSGLSWRMPAILKRQATLIYTIAFLATKEELYFRLAKRQAKRKLPYKLRMDERQSIDWVLQNIGSCEYPIDQIIRTDEVSKEELYSLISERIEEIRLQAAKEKVNEFYR